MILINAILSTSSLHDLEVTFHFPERLYVGDHNPVKITLANRKLRLPSYSLTLIPPGHAPHSTSTLSSYFIFKIGAGGQEHFVHLQNFAERGRHVLPTFQFLTSYPFGLIEKMIPIPLKEERVIYPRLQRLQHEIVNTTLLRGDYLSGQRGTGVNPYGIREHHYGDDPRHLHWPSYAKVGKWMIKEFEQEKKSRVTLNLLVDTKPPRSTEEHLARERAVSFTASLLMHFVEAHREVALWINDQPVVPADGKGFIDFYLSALALFDKDNTANFYGATRRLEEHGLVVAISETAAPVSKLPYDQLIAAVEQISVEAAP